ncbi:hypothetical protein CRG98_011818 [Punica granatum]|uniref:Uncharacterized protein n=1 Tax=Punica granatum TaxID=22663 RepID=A0A2I0KH02_PUNGR|nr:hypothetical protein CRG98_011818 [Punica granatum]
MVFKYHSFILGDDDELNRARPGSPPAFFSLLSPDSPRVCGNCIPGVAAGAATSGALAVTAHQSSVPVMLTRERLHQQHVRYARSLQFQKFDHAFLQ